MLATLPPAYLSWTLAAVVTVFTGTFVLVMFLPRGKRPIEHDGVEKQHKFWHRLPEDLR